MEITRHFFNILALMMILLFFCLVIFDRKIKFNFSQPKLFIGFVALIWFCIHMAYNPVPEVRCDLRIIPFVIGGLYLKYGYLLAFAVIGIRMLYGLDAGFVETLILYVVFSFVLRWMHPWFLKLKSDYRIRYSILLGMLLGAIIVMCMEFIHTPNEWYDLWFAYLAISPLGIGIISYLIEFVNKNIEIRNRVIKAEKLQAVEQMGAAISHEIRNPLAAASGFVQLLKEAELPPVKREIYLSLVRDELDAAEKVIRDYLTFAKPAIEKQDDFSVIEEVEHVIRVVQPLANQNSVEIATFFTGSGCLRGDRQKFHQVFINVLKNAVEAMPGGGYLTIRVTSNRSDISVIVTDTGMGMTKEQVERLGEPYYSTKGKRGTGLGMMVVYSIVRAMDGTIKVNSEVGKGTTFYFKFPEAASE
ncbi:sensor histidine kinase [Mesobacillus zeae]|uniref:histidine kinase n=1 Tax=Mesobacillus zeae TaxID=1917180 RepID=A0A398BLM8_9BACI|nr:HAMP domain-containing sensor histidine kinase [Mesobacillus zeae]RID88316.1 sensor histidine kinase [Mesobacillus zeae]